MPSGEGKSLTHAYLYVLGVPGGPHKIGYSYVPDQRAKAMDRAGHKGTYVVTQEPLPWHIARAAERYAHWLLREHHLDNEWFNVSQEVAIEAVRRAVRPEAVDSYHPYEMIPPVVLSPNKMLHGENIHTKYPAGTRERLRALIGSHGHSEFIRDAVEEKLKREERKARRAGGEQ